MAKKKTTKKASGRRSGLGIKSGDARGRHLVIVESPSKARTINKYLGKDYLVVASVGHVRDLPSKAKKGDKRPVPGVDLDNGFNPTYEVLSGKDQVVRELKRAAQESLDSGCEVWFATDLDREGEAIAWHLAQIIGIDSKDAKRVIFPAITKREIDRAFEKPHAIDEDKVNAQQARRILDRIVGYQVSPLLWKKVARGLSAGRVQSVAVRLVVEREREIRAFIPDEYWQVQANFAMSEVDAKRLKPLWNALLAERDEKGQGPTQKARTAWLSKQSGIRADLVEVDGEKFDPRITAARWAAQGGDLREEVMSIVQAAGLRHVTSTETIDEKGKGPASRLHTVEGDIDPSLVWTVRSIETKRTQSRPSAPFITSTLQQAASSRLGFGAQRTMRAAQSLYEGVEIPGEGPVGLITYMRTDSTHLSREAIDMARSHILETYGKDYLPEKANFYTSSNKAAQEAHEAIR
ncbi:MAG: hypothetical protein KDA28_04830, partial [Phycisphaerales bacterium]|nr:hypothetical protein [Phycisphaerales bacterium]